MLIGGLVLTNKDGHTAATTDFSSQDFIERNRAKGTVMKFTDLKRLNVVHPSRFTLARLVDVLMPIGGRVWTSMLTKNWT